MKSFDSVHTEHNRSAQDKRVLSGIRATGRLHLGNYLGAVKGMLELQDKKDYETLYMVADLHTMTTPFKPEELGQNKYEIIKDYLAVGLDPAKNAIFFQSDVPEHIELAFYLSTVATVARMQHLPTYKEKIRQYPHNNTMALLNYPVLMAADILIYKANLVPVGIDQEPHIEFTRELARKMNQQYGTDFPEPKRFTIEGQEYIPSLKPVEGQAKMSKSVSGSYINLTDDLDRIRDLTSKIPTDTGKGKITPFTGGTVTYESLQRYENEHGQKALGTAALMEFVQIFEGKERRKQLDDQYATVGVKYGEVKEELAHAIFDELKPLQDKRKEIDEDFVKKVTKEGAEKARVIASKTVAQVRGKMGLL